MTNKILNFGLSIETTTNNIIHADESGNKVQRMNVCPSFNYWGII